MNNKIKSPDNFDVIKSIDYIWSKLKRYSSIDLYNEEEWDDICISMAWIEEECNLKRVDGILEYNKEEF